MEKTKENAIDSFTVAYCILSVFVVMFVFKITGLITISWVGVFVSAVAPVIADIALGLFIAICTVFITIRLKVSKWIHDKRHPPINM